MSLITKIYRNDGIVKIDINSNLGTCNPIYPFSLNMGNQENAELLSRHLIKELDCHNRNVAKKAYYYLKPHEISELKKYLNDRWDARNNCWK